MDSVVKGLQEQRDALIGPEYKWVANVPRNAHEACLVVRRPSWQIGEICFLENEGARMVLRVIGEQDFRGLREAIRFARKLQDLRGLSGRGPAVRMAPRNIVGEWNDTATFNPVEVLDRALVIAKERAE